MDGDEDEQPVHTVSLDGYWIDQTEVTNGMYALCVAAGACDCPAYFYSATRNSYYGNSQYDDYPVVWVNWMQADVYCAWAGGRLPTEAEWEYAARGEDGRVYPWKYGVPNANVLNYDNHVGDTTVVGSYPAGASMYGALDMAGNVWEWVADCYGDYPSGMVSNPTGASYGVGWVLRGGGWRNGENVVRSTNRDGQRPSFANNFTGFRCSRSP